MDRKASGLNFDFERKQDRLLPRREFARRLGRAGGLAGMLLAFALFIGTFGYHFWAHFSWIDAWLNATMILTGMGPVGEIQNVGGKLFASFYALFSGIVFITSIAVILGPLLHRLLHKFHIDEKDLKQR